MARENSLVNLPGLLLLATFFLILTPAKANPPGAPLLAGQPLSLQPWLSAFEDSNGSATAARMINHPEVFVPLTSLPKGNPVSYYWLRTTLHTGDADDPGTVLAFHYLTFVDLYLYDETGLLTHKLTGAFRPDREIADGDGRQYAVLPLERNKTYTLLIRVHHTKHYHPVFDFEMQTKRQYFASLHTREAINSALLGAVSLIFVNSLLSWVVTRFRPYLWLMMLIGGMGCYVIGGSGYWIDWFLPGNPAGAWMLNMQFLYLGLLGAYLLVVDFWRLRTDFPRLYYWCRWIPAVLAVRSLSAFGIDYLTGNYWISGLVDRVTSSLTFAVVLALLYNCWPKLNPAQRYLAYGLILFILAGGYLNLSALLHQERSLSTVGLVACCIVLVVFLLFSIGLKEEMRRHELAKQAALEELNRLQQDQNILLEKRVEERTEALRVSNRRLLNQKYLLAERNTKIELLINELHHRVKNNLQLLYSLLSLQLPSVRDGLSRDILKGNIGKIRAMMLVNEKLFTFEKDRSIGLCEFTSELAVHLQKIYDTKEKTRIRQDIPVGLQLSGKHTLTFGLILSELFTNTFKHAFRDHPDPCIDVKAVAVNDRLLEFSYADNGIGISAGGTNEKFTMGIPLIKDLTRQMNGQMTVTADKGLSYSFTIPV